MAKGPQFERDFCRTLSLWWTEGANDNVFWRTAGSGGRATARAKKGKESKNHYGDIMAIDPIGMPLLEVAVIELKRGYNRHTIFDILDKPRKEIKQVYETWIDKSIKSQKQAGTPYWLLVVRRDGRKAVIFMPGKLYHSLNVQASISLDSLVWDQWVVITLEDFFKGVNPEEIKKIWESFK